MKERYHINTLLISKKEQEIINDYPILFIGFSTSEIAECAFKLGFFNMTIIDDDFNIISCDNNKRFNHQNKDATLNKEDYSIKTKNLNPLIEKNKVVINGLNINTETTNLIDSVCNERGIPVLHPFNLGWGGLVTIVNSHSLPLLSIIKSNDRFKSKTLAEYASGYLKFWGKKKVWLDEIITSYQNETEKGLPVELPIAQSLLAGMCTHLLFNIATNKKYKTFPEFYLTSLM